MVVRTCGTVAMLAAKPACVPDHEKKTTDWTRKH